MSRRPSVVGAFILGALGLGIFAILFFGGMRWFTKNSELVVFFSESLAGLDVGAPVTFNGARIGSVKSLTIRVSPETLSARIPVVLEIEQSRFTQAGAKSVAERFDYERLVKAGLRAQLALQSLITGQLRVDLEFLPDTPAQLVGASEGLPEIPTVPSDLGQLRNELTGLQLRQLSESAQRALTALARLSDHLDAELAPVTRNVQDTLTAATRTLEATNEAVHQVQTDASTALHDLDLLLIDGRQQLAGRGGELSRTLITINHAAHEAETLLGSLNGLADSRSVLRGNLEASIRDLAASASALRGFAQSVERNPNALLMGRANR
jgi:phospholipid/cholesterol/gamma-HCH transport system substrate-binding protein